ncbi:MAG TPA: CDP-alcohol phosphatidyltransferase family protein [Candidatus Binatia bacterium]|nr:CDP-alcohol phosphatidyltransferase family protein [Candidatus Binatia bacterium]
MAMAPQHWLSLARLVLGAVLWAILSRGDSSPLALPLVLLACVLDFSDGRLARARGSESALGRALDNVCDFAFLAMFFHAAAAIHLWSDAAYGVVARQWPGANQLPLIALMISFGSYAARAAVCAVVVTPVAPSPVGRAAGVLNYALALVGAAIVSYSPDRSSPLLVEGVMVVVALVNVAAFAQNCGLLARQFSDQRT